MISRLPAGAAGVLKGEQKRRLFLLHLQEYYYRLQTADTAVALERFTEQKTVSSDRSDTRASDPAFKVGDEFDE